VGLHRFAGVKHWWFCAVAAAAYCTIMVLDRCETISRAIGQLTIIGYFFLLKDHQEYTNTEI